MGSSLTGDPVDASGSEAFDVLVAVGRIAVTLLCQMQQMGILCLLASPYCPATAGCQALLQRKRSSEHE
jgi:hypothetical protein